MTDRKSRGTGRLNEVTRVKTTCSYFDHQEALTNILTSGHRDPISGTPEYKSCAVRIDRVDGPK